jgi:hypothetical protein
MKNISKEWKQTDPDINQWGRQLDIGVYEFYDNTTPYTPIRLMDYLPVDQEEIINAYGYTLYKGTAKQDNLTYIKELYPDQWEWIIAECIFESEQ